MAQCRGCGSKNIEVCLDLGKMPLAGGFLPNKEAIAKEQTFALPIHVCADCALVQIVEPVDPEILFKDYAFSSSTVGPLVQHFDQYAEWMIKRYQPASVVEFGCNDGILIAPLHKRGVKAVGIDISENITEMARQKGLDIVTGFFDTPVAEAIAKRIGQVDVVTGSNAFAHNARPEKILEAAKAVLKPSGRFMLEVMYAGDLIEKWQWDTLYHEHLTFYSLGTLEVLLKRHGFSIEHAERLPMHGGSLRLVATQAKVGEATPELQAIRDYEAKTKLNTADTWRTFGKNVGRRIHVVKETLGHLSKNSRIWAYGAAGKATLWLNACNMNYLEAIVDASPLRAGKLMPGTHTPIVFPAAFKEKSPDYVFITAWNYAEGICAQEKQYRGIWVTPLPELRMF